MKAVNGETGAACLTLSADVPSWGLAISIDWPSLAMEVACIGSVNRYCLSLASRRYVLALIYRENRLISRRYDARRDFNSASFIYISTTVVQSRAPSGNSGEFHWREHVARYGRNIGLKAFRQRRDVRSYLAASIVNDNNLISQMYL